MLNHATVLSCAFAVSAALAQQTAVVGPDVPLAVPAAPTSTSVSASDPAAADTFAQRPEQVPQEGRDGGATPLLDARYSDDSVPLPIAPVVEALASGDRLVAPASGDPDYLGFVAGAYYPPAGERIDPVLSAQLRSQWNDGRPAQETYAFVMFSKRMTPERLALLEALGCRRLGFHPYYTMKVALAPQAIDTVANLDFVRWIGAPKSWQKVQPRLAAEFAALPAGKLAEVYIDVYDSDLCGASSYRVVGNEQLVDPGALPVEAQQALGKAWMSNGWQQRALQALGLDVYEYVDSIRAFRARMAPASLEQVVALDFVQFVEFDVRAQLHHDESTPLALTDYTRASYDGGTNLVAITGEIDSGIENAHTMLNHIYGVGWDTTTNGDAWEDGCGHGSHVAGTVFGLPVASDEGYTGNAPGLGSAATLRLRNVRLFDDFCNNSGASYATLFGYMEASYNDGTNISAKPHAINNSWGSDPSVGFPWIGSEAGPRAVDTEVLTYDQLYVFSAGNAGSGASTMGSPGCAKNAFTVGSVLDYRDAVDGDPGSMRSSSSRGPCGDDRWKPNVTAPGRWIRSADSATAGGFTDKSGTSMAAPHVVGLAAQLSDHYSFVRYAPHRLASLLMATAMTNNDISLSAPSSDPLNHLNQFGAGRINAAKAHYSWADATWSNWSVTLNSGVSTNADFTVAAGCTRLIVCMTYHEAAASAGASAALVNDLDLWLDQDPIDTANNNTGEWFAHQSPRDNTEIRYISSPAAGAWRWKIWPDSTSSTSTVSVTVAQIFGDTTPNGSLSVTATDNFIQPNVDVDITAAAYNPEYFASCVFLDSTSAGDSLQASTTTLDDGAVTDLMSNQHSGRDVLVGTIRPGDTRSAKWTTRWATEGVKSWSVNARSDNWVDKTAAVNITVDGTQPAAATNLHSTSHTLGVWSNATSVDFAWTAATDNLSGIDGYGESYGTSPGVFVANTKDMEEVTSFTRILPNSASLYFALKSLDYCGNWDADNAEVGPYKIDSVAPTGPGAISSTTHTTGVQSCATNVTVNWTAASDALSGLDHYWGVWNTTAVFDPVGGVNIAAGATSYAVNIGSSTSPRYFHLRALDNAGNYGTTQHFGPVYANAVSVATYCTAKTNSLGCVPFITSTGQPDKSAGTFTVTCNNVLNQQNGLIAWGLGQVANPFQGGWLCVASPLIRGAVLSSGGAVSGNSCTGSYTHVWTTAYFNAWGVSPGQTLYAQFWMRDPVSPSTTGLSNAIKFTVCE